MFTKTSDLNNQRWQFFLKKYEKNIFVFDQKCYHIVTLLYTF